MMRAIILLVLSTLAILFGYYFGEDFISFRNGAINSISDFFNGFKDANWGMITQVFIFLVLPGLLTLIGFIWLVGFIMKISRKLDE